MNHWHWPQITYLVLLTMNVSYALAKHGEPKEGKYSFWATLISALIVIWLLNSGGFFR